MWEKIKKWFGFLDLNKDGKVSAEDLELARALADKKAKEEVDKLNSADQMIFQTEKQLKEFGEKLSEDKKQPIEAALEELKKAYESKDLAVIDPALEKINEAWKVASEEMYKAQAESQQSGAPAGDAGVGKRTASCLGTGICLERTGTQ